MHMRWFFLPAVLTLCLLSNCKSDDGPSNTPSSNFQVFWDIFDQNYSYFEQKGVDWDQVYQDFEPQINDELSNTALFGLFSEMSLLLKDLHVQVDAGFATARYQHPAGDTDNSPVNVRQYLSTVETSTNQLTIGPVSGKNVLFIGVHSLSGATNGTESQPLYDAVQQFNNYDGVIIDLRNNGGGNDGIAKSFVQRFVNGSRNFRRYRFRESSARNAFTAWTNDSLQPQNSINYTKPIIVLINRNVVSSAEGFTLMLKSLENVTLLGETTRGSTGNPGVFELPNGWSLYVSRWQVTDPDGNYIEDNGISPDLTISVTPTDRSNGRDTILEAAIAEFD